MVDMRRDMVECSGHMNWFLPSCSLQQSWKYPIGLYLALINGRNPKREEIREYQRTILGDTDLMDTAVIEVMLLPSKSTDKLVWLYSDYHSLGLSTRLQYEERYKPIRINKLRQLFDLHKPKLAIFHALGLHDWFAAAQISLQRITHQMFFGENIYTSFCLMPHGNSRNPPMTYSRVFEYADLIRGRVASLAPDLCPTDNRDSAESKLIKLRPPPNPRKIARQGEVQLTDIIRLLVEANPKLPESKSWKRFDLYQDGMSVGNYIDAVGERYGGYEARRARDDIEWDSERRFIRLERGGTPITVFVRPRYRNPRE